MNQVGLVGRLVRDPELRFTPNGTATCSFTLAVDDPFAKGEKKADFISIVTWKQSAEACANFLKKGRLCSVEGRISTRNYDNNEGKKVYVTEIIASNVRFLEKTEGQQQPTKPDPFVADSKPMEFSDSDLPF